MATSDARVPAVEFDDITKRFGGHLLGCRRRANRRHHDDPFRDGGRTDRLAIHRHDSGLLQRPLDVSRFGFDAIAVNLLATNNPLGVVPAGLRDADVLCGWYRWAVTVTHGTGNMWNDRSHQSTRNVLPFSATLRV